MQRLKYNNSDSVQTRLWCITYEHLDGGSFNIFSIGVDMDDETAELLVVNDLKKTFGKEDQDDVTIDSLDIGEIYFEAVPEEIDNWQVLLVETEEVTEVK